MTQNPPLSMLRRIAASLASAVAVVVVAHLVTVLVFFIVGGSDPAIFQGVSDVFLPSSLLAFILLAVAASLEGYRFWYTSIAVGLIASVIAAISGYAIFVAISGSVLNAEAWTFLLQSVSGPHLVFIIATTIITATVGRRVWNLLTGRGVFIGTAQERRIALVRLPAGNLAEGQVTHIERSEVDTELADQQWESYVQALDAAGWETVEVAAADTHADSVFIEDTIVMFGSTAVVGSPGSESRIGETEAVEEKARQLGQRIERIETPGTLDGGDVLKVGRTVYVGRGGRTNAEGIRQLRAIVGPLGYSVVAVPMKKALHLKTAVTALPDGTIIGLPSLLDDTSIFERFIAVPEAEGTAVVVLDHDSVLMSSAAPKTAALIEDLGYRVTTVDISEFEKLEGCVTCLSVRVR
ncbi:MAG TPA: dimethylarginine dimethylaminohydrolase [Homoserinimonas sp.]|nr:dimethylarginine dimethylaminohydrolase [Homoserinimonas sp.]